MPSTRVLCIQQWYSTGNHPVLDAQPNLSSPQIVTLSIANITATRAHGPLGPGEAILFSVREYYGLIGTTQQITSYPRTYTDTSSVSAWTQASFAGGRTSVSTSASFTAHAKLLGDVDDDGHVDITDMAIVARSFGSVKGDANYNPAADLNNDGVIDISDLAIVASAFGS